jgi:hypothetical protein
MDGSVSVATTAQHFACCLSRKVADRLYLKVLPAAVARRDAIVTGPSYRLNSLFASANFSIANSISLRL